jgi:hypothetical protein
MSNPTKIHPVANRILIQLVIKPDSTLILPENAIDASAGWDVLEVGDDVSPSVCKPGDRVLLIASPNFLPVDERANIVLADAGVVVATIDK